MSTLVDLVEDVGAGIRPDLLVRVGDGGSESLPAGVVVLVPELVGVFDVPRVRWSGFTDSREPPSSGVRSM